MRHAKSSWSDKALEDRERPLSARGRRAAPRMGAALVERDVIPDLILCSPAKRTRQTLELAVAAMQAKPPVALSDSLYTFGDGAAYLSLINKQPAKARILMLIGHNPSLAALAERLAGSGNEHALDALHRKFPTAAVALLTFPAARWRDVDWSSGRLEWFLTPRMLADDAGETD
jgi:phosphohistidine phosphatase